MKSNYTEIKFPRVIVSKPRHKKLFLEALKENVTIEALTEAKLKLADKVLKGLKAAEKKA